MKKLVFALLLAVVALSYGAEMKRHWLEPGVKYMYASNAGGVDKLSAQQISVPYVRHDLKMAINDMFTFYAINDLGYDMRMYSFDGTAAKETESEFALNIAPGIEVNLPNDMYIYVEPSYNMSNVTNAGGAKSDGVNTTTMNLYGSFSYDLTSTRIRLMSPWDAFKDQFAFGVAYGTDLYTKVGDADANEEHAGYVKVYGEYNYLNKESAMMVAPSASYTKYLNDKINESTNINFNLQFAKDFTNQFNLDVNAGVDMAKANADADMENCMYGKLWGNYFPMEALRLGAGVEFAKSSVEDSKAEIAFGVKAGYRLNFLK